MGSSHGTANTMSAWQDNCKNEKFPEMNSMRTNEVTTILSKGKKEKVQKKSVTMQQ